jgi:hypothetical protein
MKEALFAGRRVAELALRQRGSVGRSMGPLDNMACGANNKWNSVPQYRIG